MGASSSQEGEPGQQPRLTAERPGVLTPSIPWDIAARAQRERILEAMVKSCDEKTFALTTIADIVAHAAISRATFYKHFPNKVDCFSAAADDFLAELQVAAAAARAAGDGTKVEEIRTAIAAVLERLAAKPAHAKLLLLEAPSVNPEIVRGYRRLATAALAAELNDADDARAAGADPKIAFGRAKVLLANYIAAGAVERLPALLPELVYLALLPYVGQDSALAGAKAAR